MELAVELVVEDLVRCLTSFRSVSTHVVDVEIRCTYRKSRNCRFASVTALTEYQPEDVILSAAARHKINKTLLTPCYGWHDKTPFAMQLNSFNAYFM